MDNNSFLAAKIPIDGGSDATTVLAALDLSRCQSLRGELTITKADTDAGDILDVKVQSLCRDGITWNTRMRFPEILGTLTASAADPTTYILNLVNRVPLETTEESYEATESAGAGAEIAKGSVKNGPFPAKIRSSLGLLPGWRVVVDVTDAGTTNADFEGTLFLIAGH